MGLAIFFILDNRFLIIILRSFIFKTCVILRRELIRVVEDKRSIRVITHKHKFVETFLVDGKVNKTHVTEVGNLEILLLQDV